MTENFKYHFEWDPHKEAANRRKHGIPFGQAAKVFSDPLTLTLSDEGHSDDEDRWITMGRAGNGSLLVVVHTYRELNESAAVIRIISARPATKSEKRNDETG